ncbi:MAG: signal recognition particle-docking protein FtsY [Candidatus Woesearchaeota archaeon]
MFGKIKSKLSAVFSKTQEVIEEEQHTENSQEKLQNSSQNSKKEKLNKRETENFKEEISELSGEEKRLDKLEEDLEAQISETTREVEELESVDSEEMRKPEIVEIEHEQKDLDRLEEELEAEIGETSREVEQLEHIASEKSSFDEYNLHNSQDSMVLNLREQEDSKNEDDSSEEDILEQEQTLEQEVKEKGSGFFSSIFGKKKQIKETLKEETATSQESGLIEKITKTELSGKETQEKEGSKEELEENTKKKGFLESAFSSVTQKKIGQGDFDTLWSELELFLLEINIAYEIVEKIEREMKNQVLGHKFSRMSLKNKIKEVLISKITQVMKSKEAHFDTILNELLQEKQPVVIMMLGVNGTGKTTSIGKIIKHLQGRNKSAVVAAADTFRAAAVEQIEEHCKNLGVKCIRHRKGADPAAVCYDAIEHAKAKNIDVVLIDTAGRMPNNKNLMEELKKIKRVSHTDIVMFIGDSVSGNDLLEQIEMFDKGLGISGIVLTKVDTDERPGSVVTTAYSIDAPIYFLGTGQRYEDLVQFDAKFVAEQLFNEEE